MVNVGGDNFGVGNGNCVIRDVLRRHPFFVIRVLSLVPSGARKGANVTNAIPIVTQLPQTLPTSDMGKPKKVF